MFHCMSCQNGFMILLEGSVVPQQGCGASGRGVFPFRKSEHCLYIFFVYIFLFLNDVIKGGGGFRGSGPT